MRLKLQNTFETLQILLKIIRHQVLALTVFDNVLTCVSNLYDGEKLSIYYFQNFI